MQTELKEGLVNEIKSIREGMKKLVKVIAFPQFPSIADYSDDGEVEVEAIIGDIAEQYLRVFPCLALMRLLDCGLRTVSFTLGTREQQ